MRVIQRNRLTQVNDNEFIYYVTEQNGAVQRTVHAFSMRNSFKFEMEHLLYRTGFVVEQVYADFDRTPSGASAQGPSCERGRAR